MTCAVSSNTGFRLSACPPAGYGPLMDLDPDRKLALAYVPAGARPAVEALWRLDVAFAAILATGTQPIVSQMRLAWWREALERLDSAPPPAEPVLQALATHVLPKVKAARS